MSQHFEARPPLNSFLLGFQTHPSVFPGLRLAVPVVGDLFVPPWIEGHPVLVQHPGVPGLPHPPLLLHQLGALRHLAPPSLFFSQPNSMLFFWKESLLNTNIDTTGSHTYYTAEPRFNTRVTINSNALNVSRKKKWECQTANTLPSCLDKVVKMPPLTILPIPKPKCAPSGTPTTTRRVCVCEESQSATPLHRLPGPPCGLGTVEPLEPLGESSCPAHTTQPGVSHHQRNLVWLFVPV